MRRYSFILRTDCCEKRFMHSRILRDFSTALEIFLTPTAQGIWVYRLHRGFLWTLIFGKAALFDGSSGTRRWFMYSRVPRDFSTALEIPLTPTVQDIRVLCLHCGFFVNGSLRGCCTKEATQLQQPDFSISIRNNSFLALVVLY